MRSSRIGSSTSRSSVRDRLRIREYEPSDRDACTALWTQLELVLDLAKPERWCAGERLADRDFRV
jgi:hypothetical protein